MTKSFEQTYPRITDWIENRGWIEIGRVEYSESFVRAFDEGGMVWENLDDYDSLDEAFQALEAGLKSWLEGDG